MTDKRPILIAGAGIGGLTLALALARNGLRVCVVERAPVLHEVGAGLQLSPNAGRILDGFGLGPALDAQGSRPDAVRLIDGGTGRSIASISLGAAAERRWGAPYRVIHRADLQRILWDAAAGEGVDFRFGTELVDFAETDAGIIAHLHGAGGDETIAALALVGADGLYSTLRARINSAAPEFSGQVAWRAILNLESRNETGLWLGAGAHMVSYRLNDRDALNLVAVTGGPPGARGWAAPADVNELIRAFRGWAKPALALISSAGPWTKWPLYDLAPTTVWGTGRFTLIGDAAHAMLPHLAQGAAMAIEDAATLCGSLAKTPDQPQRAFRAYEAARQARTAAACLASRRNGRIYRLSGAAALARNAALRVMGPERLTARLDWLYNYRGA